MSEANCKQRFKAIEAFFRRVAFNLGNSPSQTEVKIISCIPIDVTDLQQKIFQLQKELEEAKKNENQEANEATSVVHTAIGAPCPTCRARCDEQTNAEVIYNDGFCNNSSFQSEHFDWPDTSSRQQRSTISFICPSVANRNQVESIPYIPESISNLINTEGQRKPCESRRKLFSRKKKRCNAQFVYYAQNDTRTPFESVKCDDAKPKPFAKEANKSVPMGGSYLADIARRQYKPVPVLDLFSNVSDFSTPVCRDNIPTCSQTTRYESDLCSCCHGKFQNIDNHMYQRNKFHSYPEYDTVENYKGNTYYDSNLYDLVPVKEKPVNIKNDIAIQKRKEPKQAAAKLRPACVRPKNKVPHSKIVNYCSVSPMKDHYPKRVAPKSHTKRDVVLNTMAAKRDINSPPYQQRDVDVSKMCCVDFGPIYKKQIIKNTKQELPPVNNKEKEITCLPNAVNNSTNGQATSDNADNHTEDKTETTLNQIKSILQTVLTEVKTNCKLEKPPELVKKDAFVQNGISQANMFGASQLLQSYTYSPYSIDPFIASCSRQIPSNNYPFPYMQGRLMQQYPLFIQPQKHMCSCYRNTQGPAKSASIKQAASAATNTEQVQGRSKETEQLIKEIYKSMALDVDIPSSKDNTIGKYTKLKSSVNDTNMYKVENDEETKRVAAAISEIFKNSKPLDSSYTKTTDTTLNSTQESNEASFESNRVMKNRQMARKIYRCSPNDHSTTNTIDLNKDLRKGQISRDQESEEESDVTIVNKDTEPSTSETETDDVVVHVKESNKTNDTKREKSGIFNKMFKLFKPRQRRKRNDNVAKEVQTESESDSDDYQTVYSQKVIPPKLNKVINVRSRPHSKVFYSKQLQQRRSRTKSPEKSRRTSPYMDQEYRRYWDERLMFHENQSRKKNSTDTNRGTTDSPRTRRPVYYQNYEARPALVEPIRQAPLRTPGNVVRPRLVQNPSNRADYIQNSPNNSGTKSYNPEYRQNYTRYRPITANRPNYRGNNLQGYPPNINGTARTTNNTENNSTRPHFVVTKSGQRSTSNKGISWLKKRKLGLKCGQQWKELILEG